MDVARKSSPLALKELVADSKTTPANHPLTHGLTIRYLVALSTIAFLAIVGQLLIQYELHLQVSDARIINIAGRQRMLSQRLTKAALAMERALTTAEYNTWQAELTEATTLWELSHSGLQNGHEPMGLPGHNSPEIAALFAEIEPHYVAMLEAAVTLQSLPPQAAEFQATVETILSHEPQFLQGMDAIVFQYDREATGRVAVLRNTESFLLVVTFLVLIMEGLFIFRPAVAQIYHTRLDIMRKWWQAECALRESNGRLQTLSHRLLEVQENERHSLARELHDDIGQTLTLIKMRLVAMQKEVDGELLQEPLDETIGIIDETVQQVRNLSFDLRPHLLDEIGLVGTLRWYLNRYSGWIGIQTKFMTNLTGRLPSEIEIVCFRVVQECMTNILRHAYAKHVIVNLRQTAHEVVLTLQDDGIGFDVAAAKQRASQGASWGILGMEERVSLVNGRMELCSVRGQGTHLILRFALSSEMLEERGEHDTAHSPAFGGRSPAYAGGD